MVHMFSDDENPVLEGCPTGEIVIPKLTAAGFTPPVPKDNSNGIKSFSITPVNYDPSVVLTADKIVIYSAEDFRSKKAADCTVSVRIKGKSLTPLYSPQ